MALQPRSEILLLSLAMVSFLDESYASLFNQLDTKATLKRAESKQGALDYLSTNTPRAIIATDEGLTQFTNASVFEEVLLYVRQGGLLIIGLHFPNFVDIDAIDSLFQKLGLPWKRGEYRGNTIQFNTSATLPNGVRKEALPAPYYMKVLHVKGARSSEKVFIPVDDEMPSAVFSAAYVEASQAAVVAAKVGMGFVVYDGSVNPGEGQTKLLLALCGL